LNIIRILGVLIASCLFATHATAAIILSQSPPQSNNAYSSDLANISTLNQQAQLVELIADATVQSVVVWGYNDNNPSTPPDDFTIRFFDDAGGAPMTASFDEQTPVPALREATGFVGVLRRNCL
jgi:hypothetical protein